MFVIILLVVIERQVILKIKAKKKKTIKNAVAQNSI